MGCSYSSINDKIFQPPKLINKKFNDIFVKSNVKFYTIENISYFEISPKIQKNSESILIFSHGNGCDIADMYVVLNELSNKLNISVICYDYPSYGLSKGDATEQTCIDGLHKIITQENRKVILMGQSLGTGVNISYCFNYDYTPQLLILISPFKSIPSIFSDYSSIECTANMYGVSTFNSISKIEYIKCPIKIYHGDKDEIFGNNHPIELYNQVKDHSTLKIFNNIGHNNIMNEIVYKNENVLQLLK